MQTRGSNFHLTPALDSSNHSNYCQQLLLAVTSANT